MHEGTGGIKTFLDFLLVVRSGAAIGVANRWIYGVGEHWTTCAYLWERPRFRQKCVTKDIQFDTIVKAPGLSKHESRKL